VEFTASDGGDLMEMMEQAIDRMSRPWKPVVLTFYAAGPNTEALARKHLHPSIPIVRMDKLL
jgi:hypothetical protein